MIEGETTQEIAEKVQAIPLEQRRIILYTGVHPHEGTRELAAPYEKEWQKYGVLVVVHPFGLTPHGIWEKHRTKYDGKFVPLSPDVEIDEDKFEDEIMKGDPTVVVRFHGTPAGQISEQRAREPRKLEILPSMDTDECLDPELFATLKDYFDNVESLGYPPNRICVEYWYKGTDAPSPDDYTQEAIRKQKEYHDNYVPKIYSPDDSKWWRKSNLGPEYLVQPKLSEEDIKEFHEVHATTLDYLLRNIHQRLTK